MPKVTIVTYQRAYVTGPFLQEKIGFEAELGERETVDEALTELKRMADAWHIANNPQVHTEQPTAAPAPEQVSVIQVEKEPQIGLTTEAILSCTDLKVLEQTYKWLVKGKPELERAYILKHDELSKQ